jgi:hypothetical protein
MVEIYARPLQERFLGSRFSIAYLFRACWFISLAICPVYISYTTGDFWEKVDYYQEQPKITYSNNIILKGMNSNGIPFLQYSTLERYNYLIGYNNIRQPTIKEWVTDTNLDSKPDTIDINIIFPLLSTDPLLMSVEAFICFEATLSDRISLDMDTCLLLQSPSSGSAGRSWYQVGDLTIKQRNPLPRGLTNTNNLPVVNDSTLIVVGDTDLTGMMLINHQRNGKEGKGRE